MKLFNAASLLSLVVASAMADSAVPNLRSVATDADAATATDATPSARQLTYDNDHDNDYDVKRGDPSYLEFWNYKGYCVGFDRERKGEKAKVVDCDDKDAAYVVYRSDDLLELYGTDLCLEADEKYIRLYECDEHDEEQLWYFRSLSFKGKRYYRICNEYKDYCIERNGYYVNLEKYDRYEKDQLFTIDKDFFDLD
jgi:Ricin-type beta-trefoil lectin domain